MGGEVVVKVEDMAREDQSLWVTTDKERWPG